MSSSNFVDDLQNFEIFVIFVTVFNPGHISKVSPKMAQISSFILSHFAALIQSEHHSGVPLIWNPGYFEFPFISNLKLLPWAWTCVNASLLFYPGYFEPPVSQSNLDYVPGYGLMSVCHCYFTLDILNPRYLSRT